MEVVDVVFVEGVEVGVSSPSQLPTYPLPYGYGVNAVIVKHEEPKGMEPSPMIAPDQFRASDQNTLVITRRASTSSAGFMLANNVDADPTPATDGTGSSSMIVPEQFESSDLIITKGASTSSGDFMVVKEIDADLTTSERNLVFFTNKAFTGENYALIDNEGFKLTRENVIFVPQEDTKSIEQNPLFTNTVVNEAVGISRFLAEEHEASSSSQSRELVLNSAQPGAAAACIIKYLDSLGFEKLSPSKAVPVSEVKQPVDEVRPARSSSRPWSHTESHPQAPLLYQLLDGDKVGGKQDVTNSYSGDLNTKMNGQDLQQTEPNMAEKCSQPKELGPPPPYILPKVPSPSKNTPGKVGDQEQKKDGNENKDWTFTPPVQQPITRTRMRKVPLASMKLIKDPPPSPTSSSIMSPPEKPEPKTRLRRRTKQAPSFDVTRFLGTESTAKYKKHFFSRKDESRVSSEDMKKHFLSIPVNEAEIIGNFISKVHKQRRCGYLD